MKVEELLNESGIVVNSWGNAFSIKAVKINRCQKLYGHTAYITKSSY